jgi:hypothetical protein
MSVTIAEGHEKRVWAAVCTMGLAVAAVVSPWQGAKIFGMMTLTGVIYGIAKNMIFSYRDCPAYFNTRCLYDPAYDVDEFDNFSGHNSISWHLITTSDPNLNAIVWGMVETWHISALAGIILAAVSRMDLLEVGYKMTAREFFPYCAVGASILFVASEAISYLSILKIPEMCTEIYNRENVPEEKHANLHRCRLRNIASITGLFFGVLGLSCRNMIALGH